MSYEISTPIFEGPLELLLHLIEKNELDITKVALAKVTDEFLTRVNELRETMQIEVVADFLAVAARLLWIKSRALLPKPPESARLARDEEDVGDELVRQLRAYRQYKEAAQWLRERDEAGLRAYIHASAPPRPQHFTIDLSGVTLADLRTAAQAVLFPAEGPQPQEAIQRPRISIVQQIRLIRQRLIQWATASAHAVAVTYRALLSQRPTRVEAVVTLQAILELIKQCAVQAQQSQPFGDIVIEALVPPEQIPEPTAPTE
ncbi:MAG TPA: segregation/condensation protein A [Anaerolineae bacterium]|nr:segregation/condensation protein A [Anaerolineae bacterium]HQK13410.1 segregation/condensation protein A [Anaerolineae bacterium]